jgi:hypothetical protein
MQKVGINKVCHKCPFYQNLDTKFWSPIPNQLHQTSCKTFKASCLFIANLSTQPSIVVSICCWVVNDMYLDEVNKDHFWPKEHAIQREEDSRSCLVLIPQFSIENSIHILKFIIDLSRNVSTWYDDWSPPIWHDYAKILLVHEEMHLHSSWCLQFFSTFSFGLLNISLSCFVGLASLNKMAMGVWMHYIHFLDLKRFWSIILLNLWLLFLCF